MSKILFAFMVCVFFLPDYTLSGAQEEKQSVATDNDKSRLNNHQRTAAVVDSATTNEDSMQIVLIDIFTLPDGSKTEFMEVMRPIQGFLRELPGFVEGYVYESIQNDSLCKIITTAVWKSEEAMNGAKKLVADEFARTGFNPKSIQQKLGITSERAIYTRLPY